MNYCATLLPPRRDHPRRTNRNGNAMNSSLELSDHQLRQIHVAAKALLPLQRSDFVRGVKRRLAITHPTTPCSLRSVPNWHAKKFHRHGGHRDEPCHPAVGGRRCEIASVMVRISDLTQTSRDFREGPRMDSWPMASKELQNSAVTQPR